MKRITLFLIILFILIALIFIYFCSKKETTFEKINNIKNELEQLVKEIDIYNSLYPRKQMITIPVYYINMDKSKDRNEWMIQQLSKNVDLYYRVPAVNGYSIQNKEHDIVDGVEFYNDFKELTLPEIGCTLSHLKAIHTAYENGENIAIIMEDDVYVDMINLLDDSVEELVKNAPEEWEILQLVYLEKKLNKSLKTFNRYSYHPHTRGNYECFTSSYLINRKGMENILKRLGKNPYYLDINTSDSGVSDYIIYDNATTFIIEPSIVTPYNLKIESTIHTDHTILHLEKALNILKTQYNKKSKIELKNMIKNIDLYNLLNNETCNIYIPVYYINMDKDTNRKIFMEEQFKKIKCKYTRIKGFNGKNIINKKEDNLDGISFRNDYDDISLPEIGCTLSHLFAIKTAFENNDTIAIICEDDLLFNTCSLIKPLLQIVDEAPNDWEILQLNSSIDSEFYKKYKNHSTIHYHKHNSTNKTWSSACYIINKKGMEKILNITNSLYNSNFFYLKIVSLNPIFPKYGTSDTYILDNLNTYAVLPSLFIVDNTINNSTIHTDHTDSHIQYSINTLKKFNHYTDSKQVKFARVLLDMNTILNKNNQKYFLAFGTLLGVIRENKFIEHDNDIDLGILFKDLIPDLKEKILSSNLFKLKHSLGKVDTGYELSFTHIELDVSIDLFVFYKNENGSNENYYWTSTYFNICDETPNKMCRWKYTPFTLKLISFIDKIFFIPSDEYLYLEESYGKDWMISKKFTYEEGLLGHYTNLMYEDFNKEGVIPEILTVWQYWENPISSNTPEYIKFCMDSVKRRCTIDGINYVCLNPSNIYDYVNKEDIPKNWHLLEKIAHKTDYIRALLLYKHGGLWLDADCLCLKSLIQMLDFKNTDIIIFDFKDGASISSIASRKESLFIKEWISLAKQLLEKTKDFMWEDIGGNIITQLLKKWNKKIWRKKIYNGLDTCYPLTWDQWEIFFKKGNSDFLMREFQPFIMLYNQMFPNYFKKMTKEQFQEFLKSNIVLADLFRKSLE